MNRLASDAVETGRGRVVRHGGPRSRRLDLPDLGVAAGDLVRVTVDGTDGFAVVAADADGPSLGGVYANRRLARTPGEGENLLAPLLAGRDPGSSVAVDVLDPGHHYGLRDPGERVVYAVPDRRDDGLAGIAEDLDG